MGPEGLLPWLSSEESLWCRRRRMPCARALGREDPLEEGMAVHPGILAWRILWTEERGGLQSTGLKRVGRK